MDWAKAKNVLLTIFLLLNVFLFAEIMIFYRGDSAQGKNTVNAVKILEDRGTKIECKIPELADSYNISYENAALDKNKIAAALLSSETKKTYKVKDGIELSEGSKSIIFHDNGSFTYKDSEPSQRINLSEKDRIVKYYEKFLTNIDLPVSEYYLDSYIKRPDDSINLIFREKREKYIIFSNTFEFDISKNGAFNLECKLVKVNNDKSIKSKKIIPAYQILLRYYIGAGNTTIIGIDVGYNCTYLGKGKSSTISPVWRVRTINGDERYFNASDGQETSKM